jgi:hypothetical protein
VFLSADDFRDGDETKLTGWKGIKELRLGPRERLNPKPSGKAEAGAPARPRILGGQWQGAPPEFRNLKWTEDAATRVLGQGKKTGFERSMVRGK